ncbi:unnamed protein product [Kuraishia capsulata CBS 1993]|uniref:Mitochondrial outer membrane transport complex Sam37/metaxin N-terminal domain-containing protein n=1 Tax=Kuraishia capsulata CBS 1993 TaxID=1382522 RepID=W6MGV8_9ASCO|nr:uncharacterized protein KUCA_T00000815001 [Kuraishia capsulata CBS 1993]CDK24848.1 unnamed protein product [Kuraishia capsulata CBS 1993]
MNTSTMNSISSVSAPVKRLFDAFPLKTYTSKPTPLQTATSTQYSLQFKTAPKKNIPNKWFNLIVYSLVPLEYDADCVISLDPLCSAALLYLCYKHGFSLPNANTKEDKHPASANPANVITVLSYHSSTDGELPVLVEDEKFYTKALQRSIRTTFVIQEFINASAVSGQETMLLELCDSVLYDGWIITVLEELSIDEKISIYCGKLVGDNDGTDFGAFTPLVHHNMVKTLLRRNGFSLRNKVIAEHFSADFVDPKMIYHRGMQKSRLVNEQNNIKDKCRNLLSTLEKCLDERGDIKFFFGTEGNPGAFDIKLASLIYAVLHVGDGESPLAEIIHTKPLLVQHSRDVIEGCI